MSKSSLRIVLVDSLGDVLFTGESTIAAPQWMTEEDAEPACPATRRSPTADSGIYLSASRSSRAVADDEEEDDAAPQSRVA